MSLEKLTNKVMTETNEVSSESLYPWYRPVEDSSLEQGDVLRGFQSVKIASPYVDVIVGDVTVQIARYDVIVLTQSCDLSAGKVDNVFVCPLFTREKLGVDFPDLIKKNGEKDVSRGKWEGLYLIPPCDLENLTHPSLVVNFRQVIASPFEMVQSHAFTLPLRARLSPPYREHLSQAFARFVMRIGYPIDYRPN